MLGRMTLMEELGWLPDSHRPRMIAVQAEGCAPVVKAFLDGADHCEPWENAQTVAAGLRVPSPYADYLILQCLRESGGTALTVTDDEALACVPEMAAAEGIFPCPEGAATLAALKKLLADGTVDSHESAAFGIPGLARDRPPRRTRRSPRRTSRSLP